MCSSLNDLFSCLRVQETGQPEAINEDLQRKVIQKKKAKAGTPDSASTAITASTPMSTCCIRPASPDFLRSSYQAMERNDQIF